MNRSLPSLALALSLAFGSTAAWCQSDAPAQAASVPSQPTVPAWSPVIQGEYVTAYVHEGVGVPSFIFEDLRKLAPEQVTMMLRTCSADGTSSFKLEHLRGREGQSRESVLTAMEQLQRAEDSEAAAKTLDYALVIGMDAPGRMTTTLRMFKPEAAPGRRLEDGQTVGEDRLRRAFPALVVPCPQGEVTAQQATALQGVVQARFRAAKPDGAQVKSFGSDGSAAAAAFNETSSALAAIVLPQHIIGYRQFADSQPHVAQASKWLLPGGKSMMLVLESKLGTWTMRVSSSNAADGGTLKGAEQ